MRTGCVNRDYSNSAVGEEMFRDYDSRGDDMLRDMELMTKQFEDTATVNTQIPKYQKLYENRHKKAASIKNIKVSWSGNERSGRARRGRARRGRTRRGRTRRGRTRCGRARCGRARRGRTRRVAGGRVAGGRVAGGRVAGGRVAGRARSVMRRNDAGSLAIAAFSSEREPPFPCSHARM